ncbi:ATP-binding protein [Methanobrevibacter sp.]
MENNEKRQYLFYVLKTTPDIVEYSIRTQNGELNKRNDFFELKNKIDLFLDRGIDARFYIMPGLRGVGKTTILFQLYDYLINTRKINQNQILYFDLDRLKDQGEFNILDFLDLFIKDINEDAYLNRDPLFIFVDESQYSNNWDHAGKIIFDENKNVFLIFTGSDALNFEYSMDSARRSIKKEIYPLNFSEYLYLKYRCSLPGNISQIFFDMIFSGNIEEAKKIEKHVQLNVYNKFKRDSDKIWQDFIQYGGLPSSFNLPPQEVIQTTIDIKNRVLEKDLDLISSFTTPIRQSSYSILNIIALQKPGSLSVQKLANNFELSKTSVLNILESFCNAHLIFGVDSYGSITKRNRHPRKYYFLSTQMKACIYQLNGQSTQTKGDYFGSLLENYVAASLFMMKEKTKRDFGIFYDSRKKSNVDFLINTVMGDIIPIEVGIGDKNKRQIKNAMNKYNSDFGIVVSNKTKSIVKDDDVLFIPIKTFSLM